MNVRAKTLLRYAPTWRSVLLIVALYNFLLVWNIASHWTLHCLLCPWYSEWSFTNSPSLILLAACALRLGRRFGYFVAVVASGVVVVRGVVLNIALVRHNATVESWAMLASLDMNPFLSLHTQHVFAFLILVTAAYVATVTFRHPGI